MLEEAHTVLSSLLLTIHCFILHTPHWQFTECAHLPSANNHGMLEAAGKAVWTSAVIQGQGLCGVHFSPQQAEIPNAGAQGETEKGPMFSAYTDCVIMCLLIN